MGLYPCAYSMTFNVSGNRLNAILNQRSQDMLTASNWNVVQYSLLVIALAAACGYQPGELVHVIANAHIYDRHLELTKALIQREPLPAPKLWVDPGLKDFYDVTLDSFHLENYQYHEFNEKIPVAV